MLYNLHLSSMVSFISSNSSSSSSSNSSHHSNSPINHQTNNNRMLVIHHSLNLWRISKCNNVCLLLILACIHYMYAICQVILSNLISIFCSEISKVSRMLGYLEIRISKLNFFILRLHVYLSFLIETK